MFRPATTPAHRLMPRRHAHIALFNHARQVAAMSLVATAAVVATGCVIVTGNGVSKTEPVELSEPVTQLVNYSSLDVEVKGGDTDTAHIVCDETLLPYVDVVVNGASIDVRSENPEAVVVFGDSCKVELTLSAVSQLQNNGSGRLIASGTFDALTSTVNIGSGKMDVKGIDTETLEVSSMGSGSLTLAGAATAVTIQSMGSGRVNAQDLVAETIKVDNDGSGNVRCHATESAELTLSGSGNISLTGGAEVTKEKRTGSGSISAE